MSDPAFVEFVTNKLDTLDELARRYREYWSALVEQYWMSLCGLIRNQTPEGFESLKPTNVMHTTGEHWCGWRRTSGLPAVHAVIVVRNKIDDENTLRHHQSAASWPLVSGICWVGIQLYKNDAPALHREIYNSPRDFSRPARIGALLASVAQVTNIGQSR